MPISTRAHVILHTPGRLFETDAAPWEPGRSTWAFSFHESGFFTFLLAQCPFQNSLFSLRIMIFFPSNLLSTFLCLKFHFNLQNEDCAHWCV